MCIGQLKRAICTREKQTESQRQSTSHTTEWHWNSNELCTITSDLISMRHLTLCILSSGRAGVNAVLHTSLQLTILWDFLQGKDNLEGHTASNIQWQSNPLSMDYFDCSCCGLTYYLIVGEDVSTSHAYGLTRKIQVCAEFQQSWRISLGVQRVSNC